jgi:hypothetical protein
MITDAQLRLSNQQDLATPGAGTIKSTNVVDLLAANRNIGRGQPMRLVVTCDEAFADGTSLNIQMVDDDADTLPTPAVLAQTGVVTTANLAGKGEVLWDIPLPDNTQRFIGLQYVTLGDFTTGKVSAHIVAESDYQPYLPANTGL